MFTNLDICRCRSYQRTNFISSRSRAKARRIFSSFFTSKSPFRSRQSRVFDISPRSRRSLHRTSFPRTNRAFSPPNRCFFFHRFMIRIIFSRSWHVKRFFLFEFRPKSEPGSFNNKRFGFINPRPRVLCLIFAPSSFRFSESKYNLQCISFKRYILWVVSPWPRGKFVSIN